MICLKRLAPYVVEGIAGRRVTGDVAATRGKLGTVLSHHPGRPHYVDVAWDESIVFGPSTEHVLELSFAECQLATLSVKS